MSSGKASQKDSKADAQTVEARFGEFADVYAEARSEAAEIAGDEAGKDHWQDVAANVEGEDDR